MSQDPAVDHGLIHKVPCVGMDGIQAPKRIKELAAFELEIVGELQGREVGLLELDRGVSTLVDLQDDVGISSQVRVDDSGKSQLGVLDGKATVLGIVSTAFQLANFIFGGGRSPSCPQEVKGDVD